MRTQPSSTITGMDLSFWRQSRWIATLGSALLVIAPLAVAFAVVLTRMHIQAREQVVRQLESVATLKSNQVGNWLEDTRVALDLLISNPIRRAGFSLFVAEPEEGTRLVYNRTLQDAANARVGFREVFMFDVTGLIQASSDEAQVGNTVMAEPYFKPSLQGDYIQTPYYEPDTRRQTMLVTTPLYDLNGKTFGVLAARLDMDELSEIMLETTGLGITGETYLVSAENNYLVTPSRFEGYELDRAYHTEAIDRALNGMNGSGSYESYRTPPTHVIGVHRWLPELQVALLAEIEEAEALDTAYATFAFSIGVAALAALIAAGVGFAVSSFSTRPLVDLARVATQVAAGDLNQRVRVKQRNEVGQVAVAFNSMADQFTNLIDTLEKRITARTRDLTAISEIGRIATQIHDLNILLPRIVDLIRNQFTFYHVQVFVIDDSGGHAVLKASTGEVGQELLRRGHSLPVGSDSVIGQVTLKGEPVIALDTEDAHVIHRPNPLLPDTRSEMALPLRVGNRVIGALDVQSTEPRAFEAYHTNLFQGMADQIAVAINNAVLLRESELRLQEIEALNRRLIGETWERHVQNYRGPALALTADPSGVHPADDPTPEQTHAIRSGEPVVRRHDAMVHVALPIRYGGAVIGVLEFVIDSDRYSDERLSLAQMLADRLGVSAESARLMERTRRQTVREQTISTVSLSLQGHDSLEAVLRTAAAEMSKALGARRSAVRLSTTALSSEDLEAIDTTLRE